MFPRRLGPVSIASVLLVVLFVAVPASAGQIYTDPLGDSFGPPDIVSIWAKVSAGAVSFELDFAGPVSAPSANMPTAVLGNIYLDTDRNFATGVPAVQIVSGPGPVGLGVEYFFNLSSEIAHPLEVNFYQATPVTPTFVTTVPIAYNGTSLSVSILLATIGGSGILNYGALIGSPIAPTDYVPNIGAPIPTTAPEPTTMAMFGLGAIAILALRRRA